MTTKSYNVIQAEKYTFNLSPNPKKTQNNSLMTTKNYNVIQAEKYTLNLSLYQKTPKQ